MTTPPGGSSGADFDPTERFGDRVADYVAYRPGYPAALFDRLRALGVLPAGATVVEPGSGTGILTRELLARGHAVYAVEPNGPMRAAADAALGGLPGYTSVDGTAEATTLPDACADAMLAAQAFHWFDEARTLVEMRRVLRPPRRVALVWNRRRTTGDPFSEAYEQLLLTHGTDYKLVDHRHTEARVASFFAPGQLTHELLANAQHLDHDGLAGRMKSSSYVPGPGDPRRPPLLDALRALFEAHAVNGRVTLAYDLAIYAGPLAPPKSP